MILSDQHQLTATSPRPDLPERARAGIVTLVERP